VLNSRTCFNEVVPSPHGNFSDACMIFVSLHSFLLCGIFKVSFQESSKYVYRDYFPNNCYMINLMCYWPFIPYW